MQQSRRNFIKNSALIGTGALLSGQQAFAAGRIKSFGLQLYTLRDILPADPKGVLKQVASFGYDLVESYNGAQGIFWGMKNTEFKSYLSDLGMKMLSSHCDWKKDFETTAAQAGEIGMKYLLCPHLGAQKSLDDYRRIADEFNKCGEICKKNGLRFGYHNHDYSFKLQEGQYPQDVMMQGTDPSLVDYEMDMYWVVVAGQDPDAWLSKYKGRWKLCHIKDKSKTPDPSDSNNSCTLGEGSINYAHYLNTAKKEGVECFLVEQERYVGTTPIKCAEDNAAYMKNLKLV
jgi:sugar phosphate isomerase/epimerase